PNARLNIVSGPMSPADMRYLKDLVAGFGIDAIFLPDGSDALDGAHMQEYARLKSGGTAMKDVRKMAGARHTLELSTFVADEYSPAVYLLENHGVPYTRLNTPVGLRDIDALVEVLAWFAEQQAERSNAVGHSLRIAKNAYASSREKIGAFRQRLSMERGRYIDAMVDSHKYNAEGRAAVFGEPDFIVAMVRMCCEEGIMPVVVACGTKCLTLHETIKEDLDELAARLLVDSYEVIDEADFGDIERLAVELGANVLIGSSDARRIEESRAIPLVRCAFPIHDHIGGQRVRTMGYEGSLILLDRITNALLQRKVGSFREAIKQSFFEESSFEQEKILHSQPNLQTHSKMHQKEQVLASGSAVKPRIDTGTHPCFSEGCSSTNARIHLAVAPKCNISCNYCVRKFDCPNESRPGVTSTVLSPEQARDRYVEAREKIENLTVVGIAGPGDALADFENTRRTLELIRAEDENVTFCLSTTGLLLPRYAREIADLGVTHVTVTMNAVDPTIGAKIYKYARLDGLTYTGEAAAAVLLSNQIEGIKILIEMGLIVKVNTVLISGVNDTHVEEVAKKAAELGAFVCNIMQMIPVEGSAFEHLPQVDMHTLRGVRMRCSTHIKQMHHCQQCRADAAGKIFEDISHLLSTPESAKEKAATANPASRRAEVAADRDVRAKHLPASRTVKIAVATRGGMVVDQHFGHASAFAIYQSDGASVRYLESRDVETYCTGADDCDSTDKKSKLDGSLKTVSDCVAVLALRIGHAPSRELLQRNIVPIATCDRVEDAVLEAARGVATPLSGAGEALSS
ncbi:MAG: nitrogenase cofactor biosynthesis protein NifB, partial [Actinobacteria bacterium]|nr:nitrogenase cofactor biosynthesis protein NifB [Actinomycetota bacterium]